MVLGWLLFALAAAAAALFWQRAQAAEAAHRALAAERDAIADERTVLEKRVDQARAELRARGEELGELRKKHDKLKKRAGEAHDEEKTLPARVKALEAELAAEKADARAARDEIVRLHAEVERAGAERARAGAELERERARVAELAPLANRPTHEALEQRLLELEARLAARSAELDAALRDSAKYKGRWETLDKAYVILRGELELKKDEARAQRVELERLRALEVVLTAPESPANEPS
jgi:chromosome segregation ATPase